jgi:hypothetical protein
MTTVTTKLFKCYECKHDLTPDYNNIKGYIFCSPTYGYVRTYCTPCLEKHLIDCYSRKCKGCDQPVFSNQGYYCYHDDSTEPPTTYCDPCFHRKFLCHACTKKGCKVTTKIYYTSFGDTCHASGHYSDYYD